MQNFEAEAPELYNGTKMKAQFLKTSGEVTALFESRDIAFTVILPAMAVNFFTDFFKNIGENEEVIEVAAEQLAAMQPPVYDKGELDEPEGGWPEAPAEPPLPDA